METEYRNRMTFQSEQDMLDEIARLRAAGNRVLDAFCALVNGLDNTDLLDGFSTLVDLLNRDDIRTQMRVFYLPKEARREI